MKDPIPARRREAGSLTVPTAMALAAVALAGSGALLLRARNAEAPQLASTSPAPTRAIAEPAVDRAPALPAEPADSAEPVRVQVTESETPPPAPPIAARRPRVREAAPRLRAAAIRRLEPTPDPASKGAAVMVAAVQPQPIAPAASLAPSGDRAPAVSPDRVEQDEADLTARQRQRLAGLDLLRSLRRQ